MVEQRLLLEARCCHLIKFVKYIRLFINIIECYTSGFMLYITMPGWTIKR